MVATTEAAGTIVKGYVFFNIIMHPFLMFSLSMLWGLINGIQIIAFLMLFNIPIPANILIVDTVFYEIANFDLIEFDWVTDIIDNIFGELDNNKEVFLSDNALENGYDRTNPIINLVLPLILTLGTLLFISLLKLTSLCSEKLQKVYRSV